MTKRPEPRETAERHVKYIRRKTRRKFSSEEKIRIVQEGLRGECIPSSPLRQTEASSWPETDVWRRWHARLSLRRCSRSFRLSQILWPGSGVRRLWGCAVVYWGLRF